MALDTNVFSKLRTFEDYARAEEEFQAKKQLQAATIQDMQAKAQAALVPDIGKLGEQAFVKAVQGMELTPQEAGALQLLDAKQQNVGFNPVTGTEIRKPSLLDRAGLQLPPQQPAVDFAPLPAPRRIPSSNTPMTPSDSEAIVDLYEGEGNIAPPADAGLDAELAKYANNPKMQQSIRETYEKNKINAASPEKIFNFENTLRDEFTNTTKNFRTVQDAYSKIKKTTSTGAGDMSMLYSYIKLLDPDSVVRESEFATAAASGSLGERIQGAYKSIAEGGRLPESLRNEFLAEAKNIYKGQKDGYDRSIKTYKGLANRNKLNPENVVTDYRELNPIPDEETVTPNVPKMGQTMQGTDGVYLFNGGDPAKPESWKKVR